MSKYVKATECAEAISKKYNIPLGDLVDVFAEIPAADVVKVVRCKDCTNRKTPDCSMYYSCMECDGQWTWETDNDYCSYGKDN